MAHPCNSSDVFRRFLNIPHRRWRRRRGSLGPPQVMIGLMTMTVLGTRGYENTLDEMKQRLGDALGWRKDDDIPSASAFCQARCKLDAGMCRQIVSQVYDLCSTARTHAAIGYGGFRLLAEDGTKLSLPAYASLRRHFGCPSHGNGRELEGPQASLTVLWDAGANQPVAWRLGKYLESERAHASDMVEHLKTGDLLLCDRNFLSRRYLTQVRLQKAEVLMRVCITGVGVLQVVRDFVASEACDQQVDVETRDENDQPLADMPTVRVRLVRAQFPDGGQAVYLTTLLDERRHPALTLINLYTQRWRVETAFREMKVWHGLERFHARHVDGVAQEIAAIMIFLLLASELEAQVRNRCVEAKRETPNDSANGAMPLELPTIRFNRRIVASCAVNVLYAAMIGKDIQGAFRYAMFRIWRYRQKIKPGRKFPRERKSSPQGWKPRGTKGKGRP